MSRSQPISSTTLETTPPLDLVFQVKAACPDLPEQSWVPMAGGRINAIWKIGRYVVKRFNPHGASRLFPNDIAAEIAAMQQLKGAGLAPRLLSAGVDWILYLHVAGSPWASDAAPVARCLYRLHRHAGTAFRVLPTGSQALLTQAADILADCKVTAFVAPPLHPSVDPVETLCLIHGDAVPGNIISDAGNITLIDWQCPAIGDPAEDLATFLSPAMQWLYRGYCLETDEREAFLAAYPQKETVARTRALLPFFSYRMAAHCMWKVERGEMAYEKALEMELRAW